MTWNVELGEQHPQLTVEGNGVGGSASEWVGAPPRLAIHQAIHELEGGTG